MLNQPRTQHRKPRGRHHRLIGRAAKTHSKPRGWSPLEKSKPKEVVQCLRVERDGKYNTYYGYFIDPETNSWKLFSVGRKWINAQKGKNQKKKSSLWPGSFVEVPGPPQSQRSGDIVRRVLRKGWCTDAQGKWQRLDILPAGKTNHHNKSWGATKDGWFLFKMGGMEHFTGARENITTAPSSITIKARCGTLNPIHSRHSRKKKSGIT